MNVMKNFHMNGGTGETSYSVNSSLQGMIDQEKLDSFNMPTYYPSTTEIKNAIESDGSFVVNRLEMFDVQWDDQYGIMEVFDKFKSSTNVGNCLRAVFESLLVSNIGEGFCRYRKRFLRTAVCRSETTNHINVVVSMSGA